MTKKLLGLLFVTLVFTSLAGASSMSISEYCGGVVLGPGSTGFPDPYLTADSITCGSFNTASIPSFTLTGVSLIVDDEFTGGQSTTGTSVFTYSLTGFGSLSGFSATATGIGISGAGTPSAPCTTSVTYTGLLTNAYECDSSPTGGEVSGGIFNAVGISVNETWTAGGLQSAGADILNIYEVFSYTPTVQIPEPTSLFLIGGGLTALALVARRKRRV